MKLSRLKRRVKTLWAQKKTKKGSGESRDVLEIKQFDKMEFEVHDGCKVFIISGR